MRKADAGHFRLLHENEDAEQAHEQPAPPLEQPPIDAISLEFHDAALEHSFQLSHLRDTFGVHVILYVMNFVLDFGMLFFSPSAQRQGFMALMLLLDVVAVVARCAIHTVASGERARRLSLRWWSGYYAVYVVVSGVWLSLIHI